MRSINSTGGLFGQPDGENRRVVLYSVFYLICGLAYLTNLPSTGDITYIGLVIDGNTAYATYYTSPINHDFPRIIGMFSASEIRMTKIDLSAIEVLADQTEAK